MRKINSIFVFLLKGWRRKTFLKAKILKPFALSILSDQKINDIKSLNFMLKFNT